MAHRLAVMAGEPDVEEVLRRIGTAKKFQRWCHYYELEPFGARRDNYHSAQIAKMIADVSGFTKKGGEPLSHEDLLLYFSGEEGNAPPPPPKRKQTPEEQMQIARMVALLYNSKGETKSLEELKKEFA